MQTAEMQSEVSPSDFSSIQEAANYASGQLGGGDDDGGDVSNLDANQGESQSAEGDESVSDTQDAGKESKEEPQTAEEILKQLSEDQSEGDAEEEETDEDPTKSEQYLEEIQVNGEKKQITSREEARELMQKGWDYTNKTKELANERKEFESQREEFHKAETVLSERAQDLEIADKLGHYIDHLKMANPDLLEMFHEGFKEFTQTHDNPIYKSQMTQMQQRIESMQKQLEGRELEGIRSGFETEFENFSKEVLPSMKKLGIDVSKERIADAWAKGAKDVKTAFYAEYGDEIMKRNASKTKVERTRKSTQSKTPTAGNFQKTGNMESKVNLKGLSLNEIANLAASGQLQ